jgi:hypothetical protein
MGKKIKIRIWDPDEHPGSYFLELGNNFWVKILKNFYADDDPDRGSGNLFDPGSGMEKTLIRDPGKHSGSATLHLGLTVFPVCSHLL